MAAPRERVLIAREKIAARVREMGAQITADLLVRPGAGHAAASAVPAGAPATVGSGPVGGRVSEAGPEEVVLVPILTGALVFTADLIRAMPVRMSIATVAATSYPGATTRSVGVTLRSAIPSGLRGKHVVIVDDILDTGNTLAVVRDAIAEQRPASLRICVLLRKDRLRDTPIDADYVGFDIPDAFVVGYGLDYDGLHRNVPDILSLEEAER